MYKSKFDTFHFKLKQYGYLLLQTSHRWYRHAHDHGYGRGRQLWRISHINPRISKRSLHSTRRHHTPEQSDGDLWRGKCDLQRSRERIPYPDRSMAGQHGWRNNFQPHRWRNQYVLSDQQPNGFAEW